MNPEIIIMLTNNDITVSNAEEVTVIGTWDISKDDGTSKVTATLYNEGRFVISGTGEMDDYSRTIW